MFRSLKTICQAAVMSLMAIAVVQAADGPLPSIEKRFAPVSAEVGPGGDEIPNFQKHVSPLMGRLGCNGRACHGSFQGRGDFRLSLFGYDFEADHAALMQHGRVDRDKVLESLMLTKPVDDELHEGGKRFEKGGWEYWVLRRWIEAKAPFDKQKIEKLARLEVTPSSLSLAAKGETRQLSVIARWESGQAEDVTGLCRFQTNDPSVATVDERGLVTAGDVGDSHVVVSYDNAVVPIEVLRPYSDLNEQTYPQLASRTRVDELINAKLKRLGIVPSELSTDEEFLRRVSLDVTGTLPTTEEVLAFAKDTRPEKRTLKIDELLERPGYAAQWATFFCDMTGNNDDQLRNFLPVQRGDLPSTQWYQWIHQRIEQNMPYDDLVEGIVTAKSRLPDESYADYCKSMSEICQDASGEKFADRPGLVHYWVRQNFRTPEEKAIGFAYTFLGVRIQCAQCHKHPFDQWTKADFENFERLFGGIQGNQNSLATDARKEFPKMVTELGVDKDLKGNNLRKELALKLAAGETVPFPELLVNSRAANPDKKKVDKKDKKNKNAVAEIPKARLLGGEYVTLDQADVRSKLMDWMRSPSNPYFAKALVNRVWAQYFSVGIVNPSDDLNLANAPSNAPLFDYLAEGFVAHDFDLKWLHREILRSEAYQRSWIVNQTNRLDKRNFSHSQLRRLPAETAHDAVLMALANDKYATEIASGKRSRALAVGGSSAIVRGGDTNYALSVFGRSVRETNCDCDRSNEPSLLQTVFLLNDAAVQNWLCDPNQSWVASVAKDHNWSYKSQTSRTPDNRDAKGKGAKERTAMAADRYAQAMAQFEKQSQKIEQRLKEATTKGDQEQITALTRRKQSMQQQLENLEKQASRAGVPEGNDQPTLSDSEAKAANRASTAAMSADQARPIAEQAYLRSLSRLPNADELKIAMNYLTGEPDPAKAVEGLIWSIVNTKEFILNH